MGKTEDEATKFLCCGPDGCGTQIQGARRCAGSQCMAWRWLEAPTEYMTISNMKHFEAAGYVYEGLPRDMTEWGWEALGRPYERAPFKTDVKTGTRMLQDWKRRRPAPPQGFCGLPFHRDTWEGPDGDPPPGQ